MLFHFQQAEELHSGFCRLEDTAVGTCRSHGVLLFHASHLHTQVACLEHNHDALWFERLADALLDLLRQPLLHLQPVGEDVDDTCDLAQSGDVAIGDIRHMRLTEEREHVVLAHREEVDVLDDDHLVVFLLKKRVGKHLFRILGVAAGERLHGLCHAHWCFDESLTLRVFAQQSKYVFIVVGQFFESWPEFCFWIHKS